MFALPVPKVPIHSLPNLTYLTSRFTWKQAKLTCDFDFAKPDMFTPAL